MVEYKNILFCTDFSDDANIAFLHALDLARRHHARLHILHVPHSPFTYSRNVVDEHVPAEKAQEGQAFLDEEILREAEKNLRAAYESKLGDWKDSVFVVRGGSPHVEIIRYARHNNIDVIVMGALGKSPADREMHGSTVANVSKYAHCQVMAVRNPAKQFTLPGKMYS